MACGDRFAGLLVVDGSFGRVFTPDNPCGVWCAISDWLNWGGTIYRIRQLVTAAMMKADQYPGEKLDAIKADVSAWDQAYAQEPKFADKEKMKAMYGSDSRLAMGAVIELGKQLLCLLERADDYVLAAGGVSSTPQGVPDVTPPRPKAPEGFGYNMGTAAALVTIAWVGYQFISSRDSE